MRHLLQVSNIGSQSSLTQEVYFNNKLINTFEFDNQQINED